MKEPSWPHPKKYVRICLPAGKKTGAQIKEMHWLVINGKYIIKLFVCNQ